ncbi:uncharacterized protein PAC_00015 [Phialocephala subalpina]|uniref:Uncharacterized protein n=1 Tax=Phialocephala subalpina TaxID=576137 RepID=A0A1L7WBI4_9HELO|nr:uncharacterized protein PAC_00015 [Phialocephala subalpina]
MSWNYQPYQEGRESPDDSHLRTGRPVSASSMIVQEPWRDLSSSPAPKHQRTVSADHLLPNSPNPRRDPFLDPSSDYDQSSPAFINNDLSSEDLLGRNIKGVSRVPTPFHLLTGEGPPTCPAKSSVYLGKGSWQSILNILVIVYATIFSGIWLALSIAKPRYGKIIHPGGSFAPSTASTIFALIAKTIEISSVTVFVTFLGQVLTRRAFKAQGFTLAQMAMRVWIYQPGTILTGFPNLKYVGLTILGAASLIASLVVLLYTTASSTIVSPHLAFGKWEPTLLYGFVNGNFANPDFEEQNCATLAPIAAIDPKNSGPTCVAMNYADFSYHDFDAFMAEWSPISNSSGVSPNLSIRPQASSSIFVNATIQGDWVQTQESDMSTKFKQFQRVVNNITLSMPHAGIYYASQDAKNKIQQPVDGSGLGEYAIRASVISPTSNVLCANMNASELVPIVYAQWPNARFSNTTSDIPGQKLPAADYYNDVQPTSSKPYLNSTVVDDLFEWGSKYGRNSPVFPLYPLEYNSVTDILVNNSDSIYIMMKAPSDTTTDYTVCQIRGFISPDCSTRYNVTVSGQSMFAHCEDASDTMSYKHSVAPSEVPIVRDTDFRSTLQQWALALSLNSGLTSANSSTIRLLTQLIQGVPSQGEPTLSPLLPSIAESLSVLSCSMLVKSTVNTTFHHTWDKGEALLNPGVYESFNTTLRTQEYASGPVLGWQAVFYPVLGLMFLGNAICLIYFILRMGLVSDLTEPQTAFTLAINSPYSNKLAGSCGVAPRGEQLLTDWHLRQDEHKHYYLSTGNDGMALEDNSILKRRRRDSIELTGYS